MAEDTNNELPELTQLLVKSLKLAKVNSNPFYLLFSWQIPQ